MFFSAVFILISCTSPDSSDISVKLLLYNEQDYQIFSGQSLDVTIANPTATCVAFPQDYGISLTYVAHNKIITVENLIKHIGVDEVLLTAYGSAYDSRQFRIKPNLDSIQVTNPVEITVQMRGYLCDNKEAKITKTFIFYVIPDEK